MSGFAVVLVLLGCEDEGQDPDLTPGGQPIVGPDLIIAPVVTPEPVVVPCEALRTVRITNRGTDDHVVDTITFTTDSSLSLQTELVLPRIVRAQGTFDLEVRIPAASPGVASAHFEVTSDEGTVSTDLVVDVGYGDSRAESFVVGLPKVDVLLVVDHSGTMESDYADPLARGIPQFLDALDEVADWQLILVTDDDGCNNGRVFSAADPDAEWIVDHAFDSDPDASDLTEALLELASRSLAQNAPTECNAPFLRPGSQLHVVAVSDEPEQSGRPASYWVYDFQVYSPDVTVSAIVDEDGDCGSGGDGYVDAAEATDGLVLDICTAFGPRMHELAGAVPVLPPRLVLADDALPGSIVATVDGATVEATYDADSRTVTLAETVSVGTAVDVSYAVPATCEEAISN